MARSAPNLVYILADDMGYGDLSCLNPASKIRTTHLDRLADGGLRGTEGFESVDATPREVPLPVLRFEVSVDNPDDLEFTR